MSEKSVSVYGSIGIEVTRGKATLSFLDEDSNAITLATGDTDQVKDKIYSAINKRMNKAEVLRCLLGLISNFELVEATSTNKELQANQAEFDELVEKAFLPQDVEQLELDLEIDEDI